MSVTPLIRPRVGAAVQGESVAGSTTMSAPQAAASSRRRGEKSLATTVRTPAAFSMLITARPIGPQPITKACCRLPIRPRRTACQATAMGSVSAACSADSPFGTGMVIDSWTITCSA
ncbi:hypothetical protein NONI108955_14435 [Nocardia ninae]